MSKRIFVLLVILVSLFSFAKAQQPKDSTVVTTPTGTTVDEVIWVVGDEAILLSDVEAMRIQGQQEGLRWHGNPDCSIPEQIAVHKKSLSQIRADLRESYRERQMVQGMQQKLVKDITVSPAEVRRYFKDMPQDSLPFVPTEVEVQIITQQPKVEQEEINRVKEELRDYTDRINKGESSFQTLARLYSEDPGTARRGGELDYTGRGMLDPAFANVAFGLTDPKRVSKIVESEFGFHIIQLIDKRGDKIKVRHILRKPVVNDEAINKALIRLDSIRTDIVDGKFPFEAGASIISDDKDTRNNHGLMANVTQEGRTSRFKMADLPTEESY